MRTLERPGLEQVAAGIALQAYIPDSFRYQQEINCWAQRRVAAGGAPITLRVVKGANMEMERVEASLRGWPQAPYTTKVETDANYKRMVHEAMKPENLAAVRLGVASHNLFDLAYALVLRGGKRPAGPGAVRDAGRHGQRPAAGALRMHGQPAALRAGLPSRGLHQRHRLPHPAAGREHRPGELPAARVPHPARTARTGSGLPSDSLRPTIPPRACLDAPRRTQNRQLEKGTVPICRNGPKGASHKWGLSRFHCAVQQGWQHLVNEPDTDFSLPHNGDWAKQIVAAWEPRCGDKATEIPLVTGGRRDLSGTEPCASVSIRRGRRGRRPLPPGRRGRH